LRALLRKEKGNPLRGYVGCLLGGKALHLPERTRCAHTLVVGGTGAGKSTAYFKPNLISDAMNGCSAVVIDLKYPDTQSGLFDVVPVFKAQGHDVQLFLPYSDKTLKWPILMGGENSATAAAIADILCPQQDRAGDGGFFSKQQRALLQGLILGLAREDPDRPYLHSPKKLLDLLSEGADAVAAYTNNHRDPEVRQRLKGLFEQERRIRTGIVQGLREELELLNDERLAKALSWTGFERQMVDLSSLGTKPSLLYIGIPQEELLYTRGQTLLQLLKRALDSALLEASTKRGGRLPVHTSIYLDEFAALGKLPNVGDNFATMRSRNVAYHVSLQNRAQGEAIYGKTDFHAFVDGNFRQVLLFPRYLSYPDAEFFARGMGQMTVIEHTSGTSREGFFGQQRQDRRQRETARWLLTPDEMREWPEGQGLLLQGGLPPARVLLPRLDQRKNPFHRDYRRVVPQELNVAEYSHETIEARAWPGDSKRVFNEALLRLKKVAEMNQPTETIAELSEPAAELAEPAAQPSEPAAKPVETTAQPASSGQQAVAKPTQNGKEEKMNRLSAWWQGHRGDSPRQALSAWVSKLIELEVPVKAEPHPYKHHEVARLVVSTASLIEVPTELPSWLQQGWVARSASEIAITPTGVKILDEGLLKRARALSDQREQQQREAEAMMQVREKLAPLRKDQTNFILRAWIGKNGQDLEGHPDYEALSDEDKEQAVLLGRYTLEVVRLLLTTVKTVLGEAPEEFADTWIGDDRAVRVLPAQLAAYPVLLQWCKDNAHRIKGHPRYQEEKGLAPLGDYEPETIALPQKEYERILGFMPENVTQRKLVLGGDGKRRRLYEYVLTEEPPF
jgi:type IV secretory pathway TraG/TraD family ATPase VirD4